MRCPRPLHVQASPEVRRRRHRWGPDDIGRSRPWLRPTQPPTPPGDADLLIISSPNYVSSSATPPARGMFYSLRIRIMYQAPKARRRAICTKNNESVLCI